MRIMGLKMAYGPAHVFVSAVHSLLLSQAPKIAARRGPQPAIAGSRVGAVFTAIVLACSAVSAWPAYFTSTLGSPLAGPSDCDDCFEQVFFGPGQTISYFG